MSCLLLYLFLFSLDQQNQQQRIIQSSKQRMLNPCFYYYIIKPEIEQKHLTAQPKDGKTRGFNLTTQLEGTDKAEQLWMVKSTEVNDVFHIWHCHSGLVVEVEKEGVVDLHHFKDRGSQKFRFKLISAQRQEYVINQYEKGAVLFVKDSLLVCEANSGENDASWVLRRVNKDKTILQSAIIENQNSGYVLQVPENAEKELTTLDQLSWHGMFSQRWLIEKFKEFYVIRNLKSKLLATVKHKKTKQGAEIVQQKEHESHYKHQLWSIEERGHRLYSIRLASEQDLFLGVRNYSKESSEILLLPNPNKHLWHIFSSQFQ